MVMETPFLPSETALWTRTVHMSPQAARKVLLLLLTYAAPQRLLQQTHRQTMLQDLLVQLTGTLRASAPQPYGAKE